MTKKKNPVCTILWQDAAFSFDKKKPLEIPAPNLTTGFIIEANDNFTFIATNVHYSNSDKLIPIDGLIIPEKATLEFRVIGNYNESQD